ncbi:uncharacterized protein LOC129773519 [Toxorhynchites rutilus septentrionalis]|uniref:uncharacterized protein LOC129773519 n=1 Tax=Toxorhynchites rutilus septentrionalis TaxID=329112 RepID=UPI002478D4AB|nr:uncharacterized protein LOC129773519 [Toxorhynchites rutilus septentrionalis]
MDEIFLAVSGCEYDIIILVETNLDESITSVQLFGDNYNVFRNDRNIHNSTKKSGGGVLIAVRRQLASSPMCSAELDFELVFTKVQIDDTNLLISAGYIPPELRANVLYMRRFVDANNNALDCTRDGDTIIVCGDFNQANLLWKSEESNFVTADTNSVETASACLLDNMALMNLKQFCGILNPWNHILDLVFSNADSCIVHEAAVAIVKIDRPHPPLEITLVFSGSESLFEHEDIPQLDFNCIDFVALNAFLADIDWTDALSCTDVDLAVEKFSNPILQWLASNVPKKRLPAKPPWGNAHLHFLKRKKNACQRHYRRLRTPVHKLRFQIASDSYRTLNCFLYKQYVAKTQSSLHRNPKRFWNFFNSKRKSIDGVPATVSLFDEVATNASDKCELYAKHFVSVFNTASATMGQAKSAASAVPGSMCDLSLPVITEEILHTAAKKLKSSTAPGPDGIPAVVFKKCIEILTSMCWL